MWLLSIEYYHLQKVCFKYRCPFYIHQIDCLNSNLPQVVIACRENNSLRWWRHSMFGFALNMSGDFVAAAPPEAIITYGRLEFRHSIRWMWNCERYLNQLLWWWINLIERPRGTEKNKLEDWKIKQDKKLQWSIIHIGNNLMWSIDFKVMFWTPMGRLDFKI